MFRLSSIFKWIGWLIERQFRALLILSTPVWLILMLLTGVHLFTSTSTFRAALVFFLDDLFAGQVTLEEFRWSADLRYLDLYGVALSKDDGDPVFAFEELHAQLNLAVLPLGVIQVDRLDAAGAEGHLRFDDRGGFNVVDALDTGPSQMELDPPPPGVDDGVPLIIERINLSDAEIVLQFPEFCFTFSGVDLDGFRLDLTTGLDMSAEGLEAAQVTGRFEPRLFSLPPQGDPESPGIFHLDATDLKIDSWDWFQDARGDGFRIAAAEFHTVDGGHVTIDDGLLDLRAAPGFEYAATLGIEAPAGWSVVSYFLKGVDVQLPIDLTLRAQGYFGPELNANSVIDGTLDMALSDVRVMGMNFGPGQLGMRLLNRHLYVTQLELEMYGGSLSVPKAIAKPFPPSMSGLDAPPRQRDRAYLSLLDMDYNLPLEVVGVEPARMLADLQPPLDESVLNELEGTLNAKLHAQGRLLDGTEPEQLRSLPQWHWVQIEEMRLERKQSLGSLPTREILVSGEILLRDELLRGMSPLVVELDRDLVVLDGFSLGLGEVQTVEGDVSLNVAELEHYLAPFGVTGIGGGVAAGFGIRGELLNPEIHGGTLTMARPRAAGIKAEMLTLAFGLRDGVLDFSGGRVEGSFGQASASGTVAIFDGALTEPLAAPRIDVNVPAASVNVAPLLDDLKLDLPVEGRVEVQGLRVSGTPATLEIGGQFDSSRLVVFGETLRDLSGRLALDPGGVVVKELRVRQGSLGVVEADVDWRFRGAIDGSLRVQGIRFQELTATQGAALSGRLRQLTLDIEGGLNLAALRSTGRDERGAVVTSGGDVLEWFTTQPITLNGAVMLDDVVADGTKAGDVMVNLHTMDRGSAPGPSLCPPGSGRVLLVDGVWLPSVPPSGRGTLLKAMELERVDPLLTEDNAPGGAYAEVRQVRTAFVNVGVCVPMSQASEPINAQVRFEELNVRGVVTGLMESVIKKQRAYLAVEQVAEEAVAVGRLRGEQRAEGRPEVGGGTARAIPVTSLEQVLQLWNAATIDGQLGLTIIDRRALEYDAELTVDALELEVIGETFTNAPGEVFKASVSGVGSELGLISLGGEEGEGDHAGGLTLGARDRYVTLSGSLSPSVADVHLSGELDVALGNIVPQLGQYITDVEGVAKVDLHLTGAWEDAFPRGSVEILDPIQFRVRSLNQDVVISRGTIDVSSDELKLGTSRRPLFIETFEGSAQLQGVAKLNGGQLGPIALSLESQNMTYRVPDLGLSVTFNSNLFLDAGDLSDFGTWSIDGLVELSRGRMAQNAELVGDVLGSTVGGAIGQGRAEQFQRSIFEQIPTLGEFRFGAPQELEGKNLEGVRVSNSEFDLNGRIGKLIIEGSDGFFVESDYDSVLLDLELGTELELEGTLLKPNVVGTVSILPGGIITFQNEDFTVQEGTAEWKGDLATPDVLFLATVTITSSCATANTLSNSGELSDSGPSGGLANAQDYNISMRVEGELNLNELEKLELEFTSDPIADRRDITMLILTGCTADQLTGATAGRPALALALAPVFNQIEKQLQTYVPIEEIRVSGDQDSTTVTLGQQVTDRLSLGFDAEFSNSNSQQAGQVGYLQYLITDSVILELSERNDNNGSVVGQGRIRFRLPLE